MDKAHLPGTTSSKGNCRLPRSWYGLDSNMVNINSIKTVQLVLHARYQCSFDEPLQNHYKVIERRSLTNYRQEKLNLFSSGSFPACCLRKKQIVVHGNKPAYFVITSLSNKRLSFYFMRKSHAINCIYTEAIMLPISSLKVIFQRYL